MPLNNGLQGCHPQKPPYNIICPVMNTYHVGKAIAKYSTDILFRDIEVINVESVPKTGPMIIYGNHNNQFVDGMLMMRVTPRIISFVSAAKSMRRPIIGHVIRMVHAIPLERAQDVAVKGKGSVVALEGEVVRGQGTKFTEIQPGCTLDIGDLGEFKVKSIQSDEQLTVANEPKATVTTSTSYKIIPKLEYSEVYKHTWNKLQQGGCVGIFPEGGSHDRTDLLPLKAGICIMALGAMEKYGIQVNLVSCGFHYYHPENFRSKVIMEYGEPYAVPMQLAEMYKTDKRKAIATLLNSVQQNLRLVTLSFNKPQNLSTLFTCRQLYALGNQLTEKQKVQLHRRFAKGFQSLQNAEQSKDEIHQMFEKVQEFDQFAKNNSLPISYHIKRTNILQDLITLIFYFVKCVNRVVFALPGLIYMGPMTTLVSYLSERERVKCLKASKVKLKGTDIVGSYKILLTITFFPFFQFLNTFLTYLALTRFTNFSPQTIKKLTIALFFLLPLYALVLVRSYDTLGATFKKFKYLALKLFKRDMIDQYEQKMRELSRVIRGGVEKYGKTVFNEQFDEIRIIKKEELHDIRTPTHAGRKKKDQ